MNTESELRLRGTCLQRSLRKWEQELQIDWFLLHSELVLCVEKEGRDAVTPGSRIMGFIMLEQKWKWCWYCGWASRCAQPCQADLVQHWLGNRGIFNGWGQKIHNCIPGSIMACLGLAVSVMACPYASHPACRPWCPCLLTGGFRSDVLADKASSLHTWRPCSGKQPWQVTTGGPGNLGFHVCNAQECSLLLQKCSWLSTSSFFFFA